MIAEAFLSLSSPTALTIVVIVAALVYLCGRSDGRNLPPGPTGLPLVGYLPFLKGQLHLKLLELKKKYGPVYSLRLGSRPAVVLADFQSMKEAFSRDAFIGRPPINSFGMNKETLESGAFTHLPWKMQRRFAMHMMRELGFGKSRMEGHIAEEIQDLLEMFASEKGKPFQPRKYLTPSTSNNISSLVFGKRRKFDDPKRIMLDDILHRKSKLTQAVAWLSFFPFLRFVFDALHIGKQREFFKTMAEMKTYIREEITEHQQSLDPSNIRDFIDGYLVEIEQTKHDHETTFIVPVLEDTVAGFFSAGSGTVRVTLEWLLLVAAAFPNVQRRLQREVDAAFGRERIPSWSERQAMPFTEAVILEVLRWRASLPINFPRYTIEDTALNGYFIPKDTTVIAVTWAVHHDRDLWGEDVGEFKPERFLSEDGKEVRKPEYFMPFSTGKRACTGEPLANMEVFMYFTSILQKFNLKLPDGQQANLDGVLGLAFETEPYELCVEIRT